MLTGTPASCYPASSAAAASLQEQSGAAFETNLKAALSALTGCQGVQRYVSPEGKIFSAKEGGGGTTWEAPPAVTAMMDALVAVDTMSRKLEEEEVTVTAVKPEVITGMLTTLKAHEHDPVSSRRRRAGVTWARRGQAEPLPPPGA